MPVANRAHLAPDTGRTSYPSHQRNSGEPIVDPKDRVTGIDPVVTKHAEAIRCLGKRIVADVIEIGRRLTECKKVLGHGNWGVWLDREFGWSDRQALNFMRVYELAESKSENFSDLHLPVSVLYLLAAPSTSPEMRKERSSSKPSAARSLRTARPSNASGLAVESRAHHCRPHRMLRHGRPTPEPCLPRLAPTPRRRAQNPSSSRTAATAAPVIPHRARSQSPRVNSSIL